MTKLHSNILQKYITKRIIQYILEKVCIFYFYAAQPDTPLGGVLLLIAVAHESVWYSWLQKYGSHYKSENTRLAFLNGYQPAPASYFVINKQIVWAIQTRVHTENICIVFCFKASGFWHVVCTQKGKVALPLYGLYSLWREELSSYYLRGLAPNNNCYKNGLYLLLPPLYT